MSSVTHGQLELSGVIKANLAHVWDAYADPAKRRQWSVPAGEDLVYDADDFREGGQDHYRCGPPDILEFQAAATYVRIVPLELIVYTETVHTSESLLAAALITWHFKTVDSGTLVSITNQITSFVGQDMVEGNRHGHSKALDQLAAFVVAD